jgi:hypothetical protein
MNYETPSNEVQSKVVHTYENLPFINPEDGELPLLQWWFASDSNELPPDLNETAIPDCDIDISPEYYLQVTPNGEIRGVTYDFDEHNGYFSVTGCGSDVEFLKGYAKHYPGTAPSLVDLSAYRQYKHAELMEELTLIKHQLKNDNIDL